MMKAVVTSRVHQRMEAMRSSATSVGEYQQWKRVGDTVAA